MCNFRISTLRGDSKGTIKIKEAMSFKQELQREGIEVFGIALLKSRFGQESLCFFQMGVTLAPKSKL